MEYVANIRQHRRIPKLPRQERSRERAELARASIVVEPWTSTNLDKEIAE